MAEQANGRDWALIIRVPRNSREAIELLKLGSYGILYRAGWLADCARTDMPGTIERVREQHRQYEQPFSAIVFDSYQSYEMINWAGLRELVMNWLPERLPVIVVIRDEWDCSLDRSVRVFPFDRGRNQFDTDGQIIRNGGLPTHLRGLLTT